MESIVMAFLREWLQFCGSYYLFLFSKQYCAWILEEIDCFFFFFFCIFSFKIYSLNKILELMFVLRSFGSVFVGYWGEKGRM